jgi:hypothetical protein
LKSFSSPLAALRIKTATPPLAPSRKSYQSAMAQAAGMLLFKPNHTANPIALAFPHHSLKTVSCLIFPSNSPA